MNADSNPGNGGLRAVDDDKPAEENAAQEAETDTSAAEAAEAVDRANAPAEEAMSTVAAEAGDDPANAEAEAARVDETLKQGADMGKPYDAPETLGIDEGANAGSAEDTPEDVTDAEMQVEDDNADDIDIDEDFTEVEMLVSTIRQLAEGTMTREYAREFLAENYPTVD